MALHFKVCGLFPPSAHWAALLLLQPCSPRDTMYSSIWMTFWVLHSTYQAPTWGDLCSQFNGGSSNSRGAKEDLWRSLSVNRNKAGFVVGRCSGSINGAGKFCASPTGWGSAWITAESEGNKRLSQCTPGTRHSPVPSSNRSTVSQATNAG